MSKLHCVTIYQVAASRRGESEARPTLCAIPIGVPSIVSVDVDVRLLMPLGRSFKA